MKKSANAAMLSQTLDFPELLLPNTTLCARHDGLDVRKGGRFLRPRIPFAGADL
jgi:hypothetical protein